MPFFLLHLLCDSLFFPGFDLVGRILIVCRFHKKGQQTFESEIPQRERDFFWILIFDISMSVALSWFLSENV